MSEIRKTTTIERVEAPPSQPMITLADLLAGFGWLAVNGTILAWKGSVLAYKGIRALSDSVRENRIPSLSPDAAAKIVGESLDARQAITKLSEHGDLEVPKTHAELFKTRLKKLVATNDKNGAVSLARELLAARQDRLQTTLLKFAAESCRQIGFTDVTTSADFGLVIAKSADGRRTFTVDVEKTRDGGVRINRDSDGFQGGSCAPVHDAFDRVMQTKGVRYESQSRHRKHRRPVVHRGRVPQLIQTRRCN